MEPSSKQTPGPGPAPDSAPCTTSASKSEPVPAPKPSSIQSTTSKPRPKQSPGPIPVPGSKSIPSSEPSSIPSPTSKPRSKLSPSPDPTHEPSSKSGHSQDTNPLFKPTHAPSFDPSSIPNSFHNQVQVQVQVQVPGVSPQHHLQSQLHTNVVGRVTNEMGRVSSDSTIDCTKEDDAINVAYFNASLKIPTPKTIGFIPKQESLNSVRILFPFPTHSFEVKLSSEVLPTHRTDSIDLPAPIPLIPDKFISDIPINIIHEKNVHLNHRAQVDTAAYVSVTPFIHLLFDYKEFDETFPCQIHLVAALSTNSKVRPLGVGFLHVPFEDVHGHPSFIQVKYYFCPFVTQTLMNENDIYGPSKKYATNFSGMEIHKYNDTNNFSLCDNHQSNPSKNVLIHGIMTDKKGLFTHPLFIIDLPADHQLATIYTRSSKALQ